MAQKKLVFIVLIAFAFGLKGCSISTEEPLFCTENFVTLTLQIKGEPLIDFYTIRLTTGDTLRYELFYENYYPVVDDNLVSQMKKDEIEDFQFIGQRSQNSVNTVFKVKTDGCHVIKTEGLETIE